MTMAIEVKKADLSSVLNVRLFESFSKMINFARNQHKDVAEHFDSPSWDWVCADYSVINGWGTLYTGDNTGAEMVRKLSRNLLDFVINNYEALLVIRNRALHYRYADLNTNDIMEANLFMWNLFAFCVSSVGYASNDDFYLNKLETCLLGYHTPLLRQDEAEKSFNYAGHYTTGEYFHEGNRWHFSDLKL